MIMGSSLIELLIRIPVILFAITVHESAHGCMAYLMGDSTARYRGRISLNPLRHLDPVGALCMLLFGFGWAKPVPVNPGYFKKRKLGTILVSLAGPFSNFLTGLISCVIYYLVSRFVNYNTTLLQFIILVLRQSVFMNVGLMIFNLIPVPPLDGSKVVMEFLPYRWQYEIYRYERYFSLVLILLVYAGTMTPVLRVLQMGVLSFYDFVSMGIYNLIF